MADQQGSENPASNPVDNPALNLQWRSTIESRVMSLESNQGATQQGQPSEDVLKDVKTGELWLIGVNVCLLIVQIITAAVYYKQLTQMRLATEASTAATFLASDTLATTTSQFDRSMNQVITQTASEYRAANATTQAAKSAQRAANIADTSLHVSERAYVNFQYRTGGINYDQHQVTMGLTNFGHLLPKDVSVIAHHALFTVPGGARETVDFSGPAMRSWNTTKFVPIGPGDASQLIVPFPGMIQEAMLSFHQLILVAGYILFNDGFPEDGIQTVAFCFKSQGSLVTQQVYLTPCDALAIIPLMNRKTVIPATNKSEGRKTTQTPVKNMCVKYVNALSYGGTASYVREQWVQTKQELFFERQL